MTTLEDRPNTALLVIDVQNGVMAGTHGREAVIANVARLVDNARAADVALVWVQHSSDELAEGSETWRYVDGLDRRDGEPLVAKRYPDSFENTELEAVLAQRGIGRLVEDAHTTEDLASLGAPPPDEVIAHTNLYWKYHRAPGRTAGTTSTAELDFG